MKMFKAESTIGIVVVIFLFSLICLSYVKWQQQHNREIIFIFQQQQALQIAENQIILKMANMPCEKLVKQNHISFDIHCLPEQIKIHFPQGAVIIDKAE